MSPTPATTASRSSRQTARFIIGVGRRGDGAWQFDGPQQHRHRPSRQRLRSRCRQRPHSEVHAEMAIFIAQLGKLRPGDGQFFTNSGPTVSPWMAPATSMSSTTRCNSAMLCRSSPADGIFITQLGKPGLRRTGSSDFEVPRGIDADSAGNVYVATEPDLHGDNGRPEVHLERRPSSASGAAAGGAAGQFCTGRRGIATDSAGNVYVADSWNNRIQKFTADGAFVTAGEASGRRRAIHALSGLATDPAGNVYVADTRNSPYPEVHFRRRVHHPVG